MFIRNFLKSSVSVPTAVALAVFAPVRARAEATPPPKVAAANGKVAAAPKIPAKAGAKPVAQPSGAKPALRVAGKKDVAAKTIKAAKVKVPAKRPGQVSASDSSAADTRAWVQNTHKWTRTLLAADDQQTPAFSEALALAVDGQYLVVPWNFVSEVWLARPHAHFYLDETKQEVSIVDLDMVANIAIFKTQSVLAPSFTRNQIRVRSPLQDEPLYVLASRDWIRPGARFLREKVDGAYSRLQIAFFNGDYASARYVFDRTGQLVAIGSGAEGADKSWSGSARSLFDLLRRQDGPHPASVSTSDQRRRQLFYWQERWARALVPAPSTVALHALDCQAYVASVPDAALASQVRNVRALDCEGKFPLQLGAGYTTGIRMWAGDAALRSGDDAMSAKLVQAFAAEAFGDLNKSAALVNLMTVPDCSENSVSNRKGQTVQVKFCTTALKVEPGLSDTAISVSSLDPGTKSYFAVARLKGFDQMNTKKVLESLIENVRSLK